MNQEFLRKILAQVKKGDISLTQALKKLKELPFHELGFAKVDLHRGLRRGVPEVIFCPGKTAPQIIRIIQALDKARQNILATRLDEKIFSKVAGKCRGLEYNAAARLAFKINDPPAKKKGYILVLTAGTSDIPVAEEAAVTAEIMGNQVERIYDVGIAGVHRLIKYKAKLQKAQVIIVAAGMEGALASIVSGLVHAPVIALPTSVGYGASFGGLSALLGMLNACSPGVVVVNIDNGFGAGYFAHLINK